MRRTRAYTDTELGLARHAQTGEYFHGSPQQWRAYLDTLTGPEADRPDYEVVAGPPIITLHGWWWQPGLDDMFLEVLGNAGYDVHIARHVADAMLLPRHPVGHVHILGDEGERTWFVLGGQHFTWSSFVRLACQTDTVQTAIAHWFEPGDDIDWEGMAKAECVAADLIARTIPPAHLYHRIRQLETASLAPRPWTQRQEQQQATTDLTPTGHDLIRAEVLRTEAAASGDRLTTTTVHITVTAAVLDTADAHDRRDGTDWRNALCVTDPRTVLPKWARYQLACVLAEAVADQPRPGNALYYEIRSLDLVSADDPITEHAERVSARYGPVAHLASLTEPSTRA